MPPFVSLTIISLSRPFCSIFFFSLLSLSFSLSLSLVLSLSFLSGFQVLSLFCPSAPPPASYQVTWFSFPSTPAPFLPHVPVPNNNNHTNTTSTFLSTMRNSRRPKFTMMSGGLVVVEVRVLFMGQYIHHTQYRHSNTFWSLFHLMLLLFVLRCHSLLEVAPQLWTTNIIIIHNNKHHNHLQKKRKERKWWNNGFNRVSGIQ